jgi:hypothetical protein
MKSNFRDSFSRARSRLNIIINKARCEVARVISLSWMDALLRALVTYLPVNPPASMAWVPVAGARDISGSRFETSFLLADPRLKTLPANTAGWVGIVTVCSGQPFDQSPSVGGNLLTLSTSVLSRFDARKANPSSAFGRVWINR